MKYLFMLLLGIATGVLMVVGFLLYSPMSPEGISPLSVSERPQFSLSYSAVVDDAIAYTNNGESPIATNPDKIAMLWEAPLQKTVVLVTALRDGRGSMAGIGIKFSSRSEETRLLQGEALVNSVWHVVLPDQGTLLVAQAENHWNYLREVVIPAYWSSADNWKGSWHGTLSSGPGALGTGDVHGGSGRFRDYDAEAIETLTARAYSTETGPVAVDGQLIIEQPVPASELSADVTLKLRTSSD
ncbi:MAG TPA: hypothetical protein PKK10_01480 [Woeseiaceae bacterium]|nr:hypothetical protein [Woeseiaceae bacterium]